MGEFFQQQLEAARVAGRPKIRLAQSRIRMTESRFERGSDGSQILDRKFEGNLFRLFDARNFAGKFQEYRARLEAGNQTLFLGGIGGLARGRPEPALQAKALVARGPDRLGRPLADEKLGDSVQPGLPIRKLPVTCEGGGSGLHREPVGHSPRV